MYRDSVKAGTGWFAEVGIKEGDVVTGLPLPSTANSGRDRSAPPVGIGRPGVRVRPCES